MADRPKRKVEFIESYWTGGELGSDYQWNDNHGELIRCKDCVHWIPGIITDKDDFIQPRCERNGGGWSSDDYCSCAERRKEKMTERKVPVQSLIDHIKTAVDVDQWAKDMAEELLKEQEPKPVIQERQCEVEPNVWERKGFCPKCHQIVLWSVNRLFCGFCGQAVKWNG